MRAELHLEYVPACSFETISVAGFCNKEDPLGFGVADPESLQRARLDLTGIVDGP